MSSGKKCTSCEVVKPLTEFHKHRLGRFGLAAECKSCTRARKIKANPLEAADLQGEIWKSVPGFPNYECSNFARVRRSTHAAGTRKGYVLKQFPNRQGYFTLQLDGRSQLVHRIVALTFLEKPKGKDTVNHIDAVPTHNRPENLEWVTHEENVAHAVKMGLIGRGETHSHSKLSKAEVLQIRKIGKSLLVREIAEKYNVSRGAIRSILSGRNWKHL